MDNTKTKRCSRCDTIKPVTGFHRNRAEPDGLQRWCIPCRKEHSALHYQMHKEERHIADAAYRAENRDELRQRSRKWRADHPVRVGEQAKRSKERHKKRAKRYNAQYRGTHRQEHKRANRRWYRQNKARFNSYAHERRARMHSNQYETIDRATIFARSQWICGICGGHVDRSLEWPDPRSASLDHIIPLSKDGTHTQDNVQLAHLCCNMSKFTTAPDGYVIDT